MTDDRKGHVQPAGRHWRIPVQNDVGPVFRAGCGEHTREGIVRERTMFGTDRVHVIDESRARDVRAVVRAAVADEDHANLRIVQMRLKPVGGDDRVHGRGREQRKDVQHAITLLVK